MKIITSDKDFKESRSRSLIQLQCYSCNKTFQQPKNQILAYIKHNLNGATRGRYCSKYCLIESQKDGKTLSCKNCKKNIYRSKSQFAKKSNHFCSQSCSAVYFNHASPKRTLQGSCIICSKQISINRNYCKPCSEKIREQKKEQTLMRKKQPENILKKKEYMRKAIKSYVRKLKEKMINYKGGQCQKCGYKKCNTALEFHHLDPSKKEFGLSGLSIKFETIKPELDKCIMVCANCHRELHEQIQNQKDKNGESGEIRTHDGVLPLLVKSQDHSASMETLSYII